MSQKDLLTIKNRYGIVGNDPELGRALEVAMAVATSDIPVLVSGESGTGKDIIPQIIHQNSLRRGGKYLALNCGGIPEGTVDSELFGHEKGSFTGAIEQRKGYFEEADGGTLFLDEIAELPLTVQAKLLRVMQSGEFCRVGSSKVLKTNVRVIAATNVNLAYAVSRGKFREDLLYRFNAVTVSLPPLRERVEDIPLLFRKFTSDFSEKFSHVNVRLTEDAIARIKNYHWPGNVRQLKNVAEAICTLETPVSTPGAERVEINSDVIDNYIPRQTVDMLPAAGRSSGASGGEMDQETRDMIFAALRQFATEINRLSAEVDALKAGSAAPVSQGPAQLPAFEEKEIDEQGGEFSLKDIEDERIRKAMDMYGNHRTAAQHLGISERTLYRKLKAMKHEK
ncbi:MAG: sigma-54 dependent transcriptional regulator [Bacteroidales bacterium]|nr:sigma-54 dependent transcriptional regulator [Bacteroidales bacterium]